MKRILILSALCALFLLPSFAAAATPVCTSPAGISVSGNDPIDQILAVLKDESFRSFCPYKPGRRLIA